MERLGLGAVRIELNDHEYFDLCDDTTFNVLRGWIQGGVVAALWCGTPCSGLTRARRGPPGGPLPAQLRSNEHVHGLPTLTGKDAATVKLSNKLAARAFELLKLAQRRQIPCGEENPQTSFLWSFPSRQRFLTAPGAMEHTVDYCACGRPFRARTKLVTCHFAPPKRLAELRCRGRGICDFSGKPHLELSGLRPQGGFYTSLKSQYPESLRRLLAQGMMASYAAKRVSRRWNLMR